MGYERTNGRLKQRKSRGRRMRRWMIFKDEFGWHCGSFERRREGKAYLIFQRGLTACTNKVGYVPADAKSLKTNKVQDAHVSRIA